MTDAAIEVVQLAEEQAEADLVVVKKPRMDGGAGETTKVGEAVAAGAWGAVWSEAAIESTGFGGGGGNAPNRAQERWNQLSAAATATAALRNRAAPSDLSAILPLRLFRLHATDEATPFGRWVRIAASSTDNQDDLAAARRDAEEKARLAAYKDPWAGADDEDDGQGFAVLPHQTGGDAQSDANNGADAERGQSFGIDFNWETRLHVVLENPSDGSALSRLAGFDATGLIRIWPGEEALAWHLLASPELVAGRSVLELGAGQIGLAGLVAAAREAHTVTLTDGNLAAVQNLQRCVIDAGLEEFVAARRFEWAGKRVIQETEGEAADRRVGQTSSRIDNPLVPDRFDLILSADCVFFADSHAALLDALEANLAEDGVALICAPQRKGSLKRWIEAVEKRGGWFVHLQEDYNEVLTARRRSLWPAGSAQDDENYPWLCEMMRKPKEEGGKDGEADGEKEE